MNRVIARSLEPRAAWLRRGAPCFDIVEDPSACAYTETGLAVNLAQVPALDEQSRVQVSCVAE